MNFILIVYAAPGACRKAAKFLARPFASAGGGYSKRQIYLSFTIILFHFHGHGLEGVDVEQAGVRDF